MPRFDQEAGAQGRRIGRYEVLGEIASGGMATVYLARSLGAKGFSRFVAIKRLHPHLEAEEDFVHMFLDEARLAARIRHPNVVATIDVEDSEGLYIVMEYIEGVTLLLLWRQALKLNERMPPAIAARMILDTLGGLHAAHELLDDNGDFLSLVHRDVSPQNILIGTDGIARITDFGIAKASSRLGMTRDGQLKGKISYMAPEQTKRAEIDRRVDLFAAGIVMWELLAGRRLFSGESDVEVLNQLLFEPIPRLRDHAPSVPSALEEVVMRCLERDPNNRYNTAHEFADAIERSMKVLGGPANHRAVAAFVQKVAGERIAREKGRIANGAPPLDPNGTGSFKAIDQPLPVSSRVRPAPPAPPRGSDAPGEPSDRKRPATMAPAIFSAVPSARASGASPTPMPPRPATGPAPAVTRSAKSTVMGLGLSGASPAAPRSAPPSSGGFNPQPPSAPTNIEPGRRSGIDLTYEAEFEEEMPTMQASAPPRASLPNPPKAPAPSQPQGQGFFPAAPVRPAEEEIEPEEVDSTPADGIAAIGAEPDLTNPSRPNDDIAPAALAPQSPAAPADVGGRHSAAAFSPMAFDPTYNFGSGVSPSLQPPAPPAPSVPPSPPFAATQAIEGPQSGYLLGSNGPAGASVGGGYSLGSLPPTGTGPAPVVPTKRRSKLGIALAVLGVLIVAGVGGAFALDAWLDANPVPAPAPAVAAPAPAVAAPTPAVAAPAPTPPAGPTPPVAVPAPAPAAPAPAARALAPPAPAPAAPPPTPAPAPPVAAPAPAPPIAAPQNNPAPAASPPTPRDTGAGRRGRHRRRDDDAISSGPFNGGSAPVALPPPAPVAQPAPRPRRNTPDPDAPDLGDPYR